MTPEEVKGYEDTNANGGLSPILDQRLFLSGRNPPQNFELIKEKKITHILSITLVRLFQFAPRSAFFLSHRALHFSCTVIQFVSFLKYILILGLI